MKPQLFFLFILFVCAALPVSASADRATISIPSLNITASITTIPIERQNGELIWNTENLGMNVGVLDGTPWINRGGNTVIGGHYDFPDRTPSVFYNLTDIQLGDEIIIIEKHQKSYYRVVKTATVAQTDISVVYQNKGEQLTLMTCFDFDEATNTYLRRFIVVAVPL